VKGNVTHSLGLSQENLMEALRRIIDDERGKPEAERYWNSDIVYKNSRKVASN
jgi:hypothetical protein